MAAEAASTRLDLYKVNKAKDLYLRFVRAARSFVLRLFIQVYPVKSALYLFRRRRRTPPWLLNAKQEPHCSWTAAFFPLTNPDESYGPLQTSAASSDPLPRPV